VSNFEPLRSEEVLDMMEKAVDFDAFTPPMKKLLRAFKKRPDRYAVCSDNPRRIDGAQSKNPRYLQDRPDMVNALDRYVAEMGVRLFRAIPAEKPVPLPVNAILAGRRNNPPESQRGIRSLAVYGPIHYQELPELFMDYIASLTGKSPSTTGAGSEGALTKGPFNALRPAADLNAALVAMILTGHAGFSTAAGHVGPNQRFDHDLSLLVPEVWCRMTPEERRPEYLIENDLLERLDDYTYGGKRILAGRLGYRITERFTAMFFGRVFDQPDKVFDEAILRPETQDPASFADGVQYICEAHERVAKQYFDDGTIDELCPPLRALVTIMARGSYEGRTERDPEIRRLFTREALLESDWYARRLRTGRERELALLRRLSDYLDAYPDERQQNDAQLAAMIAQHRQHVAQRLEQLQTPGGCENLQTTLGAQPQL
jgi:phosphoenolpyruvate carboxykinase (diphosphate)